MLPRELTTERLLLRQWRAEDVEPLFEIYMQPEFLEYMPARTYDETAEQAERFARAWREDGYCQWAACDLESGRLIGRIGIIRHHDWPLSDRPVPEVGWVLHRDFWGRGLATEGGRASLDAWRESLPAESRLYSFTTANNARSLAVMRRLGLAKGGEGVPWHGHEIVWHYIDRSASAAASCSATR
jgi:RimJ/RimL family protein N-acetyltransferase